MIERNKDIVYFIYDGDCPLCQMGASLYEIRQTIGTLETIDARTQTDHPVIQEVNQAGLNFDDGMVIKYQGKLYHGADALHLMAQLGAGDDWLNAINARIYRSRQLVNFSYPVLKSFRNLLLRIRGVDQIRNLERKWEQEPIFKPILDDAWDNMPALMQNHYANRAYSDDSLRCEGVMDIWQPR